MKSKLIILVVLSVIITLTWNIVFKSQEDVFLEKIKQEENTDEELKDRIGQMLIVGFRGTEISNDSYIVHVMKDVNIGGVILFDLDVPSKSFPRNIVDPQQTKNLIQDLQKFSPTPLFIAVDAEGGAINRLKPKYGFNFIPSAKEMGKNNPIETEKIASKLARQLADLGFNINFAPVVDLDINKNNPIIGALERSFSESPEKVIAHASVFIEAHRQHNVIATIKHFPGHGSSRQDSHKGMVDITKTYQEEELIPYRELIQQNLVDAIMTAHVVNRNSDTEYPATLSSKFITDILRKQLKFQGIVVSDDMQMGAITKNFGFAESIVKTINAGCDLIIISNNSENYDESIPYQVRDAVFDAVKKGEIPINRIIESSDRIYMLKKNFEIIK